MLHIIHIDFFLTAYCVFLVCLQYTILDDGFVCMEFFRVIGGAATVLEVMRISANGLQVIVSICRQLFHHSVLTWTLMFTGMLICVKSWTDWSCLHLQAHQLLMISHIWEV